jgi:hypothetical protein
MKTISTIIIITCITFMITTKTMDDLKCNETLPLSLHFPQVKKPSYDNFYDLVKDNAIYLQGLFAEGQCAYSPQLAIAEKTLRRKIGKDEYFSFLNRNCDQYYVKFVLEIACKDEECRGLVDAIAQPDFLKIDPILRKNRMVVNHYFECPTHGHKITPLHYAILRDGQDNNKQRTLRLLHAGANSNAVDGIGNTPLHKAKTSELIELLLGFAAQSKVSNRWGYTPLVTHIRQSNNASAVSLIKSGAFLNLQDCNGDTALHHAVNENNDTMVQLLLESGADFHICNTNKQKPFCTELGIKKRKIVEPHIHKALWSAFLQNSPREIQFLVQEYPWVSFIVNKKRIIDWAKEECEKDSSLLPCVAVFERALGYALFAANADECEGLINAGASANQEGQHKCIVPLSWAIRYGNKAKIAVLLRNGALVGEEMIEFAVTDELKKWLRKAYKAQQEAK